MATNDSRNIFERVYNGMMALCGEGSLSERLERANQTISPLLLDDFPEAMRDAFLAITRGIVDARDSETTDEDRKRLSEDYVRFYTKAARLNGKLQQIIGD